MGVSLSKRVWATLSVVFACVSLAACGGSDQPSIQDQQRESARAYVEALEDLPYVFEFQKAGQEPGIMSGRAKSQSGAEVKFVLSMGPKPVNVLKDYPKAYDSGSIYGGTKVGMFYVWKNYPAESYSKKQLNSFYDMHADITNVACHRLFGKDCEI